MFDVRSDSCSRDAPTTADFVNYVDDVLFNKVLDHSHHVLYIILFLLCGLSKFYYGRPL